MINQVCPNPVDAEQVQREENYRDQSDDRRVLNFVGRRPRHAAHLGARVPNKLPGSREEPRRGGPLFGARRRGRRTPFRFKRFAAGNFRHVDAGRFSFEFAFFFAHGNVV